MGVFDLPCGLTCFESTAAAGERGYIICGTGVWFVIYVIVSISV